MNVLSNMDSDFFGWFDLENAIGFGERADLDTCDVIKLIIVSTPRGGWIDVQANLGQMMQNLKLNCKYIMCN